jgi:hypothetical protein
MTIGIRSARAINVFSKKTIITPPVVFWVSVRLIDAKSSIDEYTVTSGQTNHFDPLIRSPNVWQPADALSGACTSVRDFAAHRELI